MISGGELEGLTMFNRHANCVRAHAVGVGVKQQNAIPCIKTVAPARDAHSQTRGRRDKLLITVIHCN